MSALAIAPVLFRIEYADGLRGSLLMLSGLVTDFTVAIRLKGQNEPLSTQMYLAGIQPNQTLPDFFNPLVHHIETMFKTGTVPYPIERTLLTTGLVAAGVDSLHNGQKRIDTPDLARVRYLSPRESTLAELIVPMVSSRSKSDPASTATKSDQPRKRLAIVTTVWRLSIACPAYGGPLLVGVTLAGEMAPARDRCRHALYVDQKTEG